MFAGHARVEVYDDDRDGIVLVVDGLGSGNLKADRRVASEAWRERAEASAYRKAAQRQVPSQS